MRSLCKQDVAPIERENERDENYKSDNPQIDSSKTKYNYHMHSPDGTYTEFINRRITDLNLSPRKDAVVMNSFVVGADKAFFDGLSKLGKNAKAIQEYVTNQLKGDREADQLSIFDPRDPFTGSK